MLNEIKVKDNTVSTILTIGLPIVIIGIMALFEDSRGPIFVWGE